MINAAHLTEALVGINVNCLRGVENLTGGEKPGELLGIKANGDTCGIVIINVTAHLVAAGINKAEAVGVTCFLS